MPDATSRDLALSAALALLLISAIMHFLLPLLHRWTRYRVIDSEIRTANIYENKLSMPAPNKAPEPTLNRAQKFKYPPTYKLLSQSYPKNTRSLFVTLTITLVFFFTLTKTSQLSPVLALTGSAIGGGMTARVIYLVRRAKLRKMLDRQIPGYLEFLIRSLRVGHSLPSSIELAAKEISEPLRYELIETMAEVKYGRSVSTSLQMMADRLASREISLLAKAVRLNEQSGGNLSTAIESLAKTIRARQRLRDHVVALTSEARYSGKFLSIFPFLIFPTLKAIDPNYFTDVAQEPYFASVSASLAALMFLNALIINFITRVTL